MEENEPRGRKCMKFWNCLNFVYRGFHILHLLITKYPHNGFPDVPVRSSRAMSGQKFFFGKACKKLTWPIFNRRMKRVPYFQCDSVDKVAFGRTLDRMFRHKLLDLVIRDVPHVLVDHPSRSSRFPCKVNLLQARLVVPVLHKRTTLNPFTSRLRVQQVCHLPSARQVYNSA